tara:strand:- start:9170 stop:9496 length:327 start_codon:yes stop_codon:yes gene_type:complete
MLGRHDKPQVSTNGSIEVMRVSSNRGRDETNEIRELRRTKQFDRASEEQRFLHRPIQKVIIGVPTPKPTTSYGGDKRDLAKLSRNEARRDRLVNTELNINNEPFGTNF